MEEVHPFRYEKVVITAEPATTGAAFMGVATRQQSFHGCGTAMDFPVKKKENEGSYSVHSCMGTRMDPALKSTRNNALLSNAYVANQ